MEILKKVGIIGGFVFAYSIVLLSLMPVVSLWAGIIALVFLLVVYFGIQKLGLFTELRDQSFFKHWFKLSIVATLFGVILHSGCSVYSNYRVQILYDDCKEQKKQAFKRWHLYSLK